MLAWICKADAGTLLRAWFRNYSFYHGGNSGWCAVHWILPILTLASGMNHLWQALPKWAKSVSSKWPRYDFKLVICWQPLLQQSRSTRYLIFSFLLNLLRYSDKASEFSKLLFQIIADKGELFAKTRYPDLSFVISLIRSSDINKEILRQEASLAVVKLAGNRHFEALVKPIDFCTLARATKVIQKQCFRCLNSSRILVTKLGKPYSKHCTRTCEICTCRFDICLWWFCTH